MHIELTEKRVGTEYVMGKLNHDGCGAIVVFTGTVRPLESGNSINELHYECYPEMAYKLIEDIVRSAMKKYGLNDAVVVHRYGDVPAGEASVVVAASSGHRKEAFGGCSEIIDRIKAEVPIWKKDIGERTQWQSERK